MVKEVAHTVQVKGLHQILNLTKRLTVHKDCFAIFLRNQHEEEESATLLQKKSSERIKQSMEENTVEERG